MAFDGGLFHVILRLCELSTVIETEVGGWLGTNKEKREKVKMVNDWITGTNTDNILKETIQMWLSRNEIGRRKAVANLKSELKMNLGKDKDQCSH